MSLVIPDFIAPLLAKPVAVLGGGRSGQAVLALLAKLNTSAILYDENPPAAPATDNPQSAIRNPQFRRTFTATQARTHALVIFSPGFRPDHKWLLAAHKAGCETLGELDFASLFWRGSIIAITGTNGKTTLTEFLTHALRSIGHDAHSTGNIGTPFSSLVTQLADSPLAPGAAAPTTPAAQPLTPPLALQPFSPSALSTTAIAVVEVSSFQSETLKHFRADSALWTNFAEDHLERHHTLRAYFVAKWRLLERTLGGIHLAGTSVQRHAAAFDRALPPDACVPTENQPADILLANTPFEHYPQRENFLLAAAWWRATGLPETPLYAAAHTFRLARHRLQHIATINNVTYWNDSKATNFHATEAALTRFTTPPILILGGLAKGGDIPAFVRRIAPKIKHALLIGATAPALAAAFQSLPSLASDNPQSAIRNPQFFTPCATLADAVLRAATLAQPNDAVLLSPAFASFDMFRNYEDRGTQFELQVSRLPA